MTECGPGDAAGVAGLDIETHRRAEREWRRAAELRQQAARTRAQAAATREQLRRRPIWTPVVAGAASVAAGVLQPERLAAVVGTGLLDTEPESCFDDLVQLACEVVDGDVGFFTVVDAGRSFWKSAVGVDLDGDREAPVETSLCQVIIDDDRELVVEDASSDARVAQLGLVRALGMGACAGYPVRDAEGHVLGGLCVVTKRQRRWSDDDRRALSTLARALSIEVQLRVAVARSRRRVDTHRGRAERVALEGALRAVLLPPRLPALPGCEVAAAYLPADGEAFTGDFYDLFEVDGSWWVAMGDVSGHGLEAAATTALARYTLRAEASHDGVAPSEVLARLHHVLRSSGDGMRLLTAALTVLRPGPATMRGHLCSAGHEPPLIRRASGAVELAPGGGMLLGATDGIRLCDVAIDLGPGDALVMVTDGVTEARPGRGGELFEQARLVETLGVSCGGCDASGIVQQIIDAAYRHSNGHLTDDIAVLVIRLPTGDQRS